MPRRTGMLFTYCKKRIRQRAERIGEKEGEKLNQKQMKTKSLPPKRPPELLPTHRRCPLPGKDTLIAIPARAPDLISCLQPTPPGTGLLMASNALPHLLQPHPAFDPGVGELIKTVGSDQPPCSSYSEQNTRAGTQSPTPVPIRRDPCRDTAPMVSWAPSEEAFL